LARGHGRYDHERWVRQQARDEERRQRAEATIAATAACSGDSSRVTFDSLFRDPTRSDVITHNAHPAAYRFKLASPVLSCAFVGGYPALRYS
jgi:hypothetical protein